MVSNTIYYVQTNLTCLVLLTILFVSIAQTHVADKRKSLYFFLLVLSAILCISDLIAGVFRGVMSDAARYLLWTANITYFVSGILLAPVWVVYSMYILSGRVIKPIVIVYNILCVLACLFFVTSPFHHLAFYIDNNNLYVRGPMIWVQWITLYPGLLLPSFFALFSKAEKKERFAIAVFAILPLSALVIQCLFYGVTVSQVGLCFGLFLIYVLLQSRTVNEAVLRAELMDEISNTDPLTKINNRRAYETRLIELKSAPWVGVDFIDLNGLKFMNDNYGHQAGDRMICNATELLKKYFPMEEIFRISGDEFVVLTTRQAAFYDSTENLIQAMNTTASCGRTEGVGAEIDKLVRDAEARMYRVKSDYYVRSGLNRRT